MGTDWQIIFELADPYYYEKQMIRMAVLAAYNGPITIYYGDEYADRTLETKGGQPDNVARTRWPLIAKEMQKKKNCVIIWQMR